MLDQLLRIGQTVRTESSGLACPVREWLGGGGQGEVYRAELAGRDVALKWYFPGSATVEQRAALETLAKKGPPNARFLWPMELASAEGVPGFGYVMPLRESRYKGIIELMKGRINPSFRAIITAGLGLADSFLQLHTRGLCYRDISFGNAFLDPDDGQILICDNDNVTVDGDPHATILGTPRFMAPEIVRCEATPSTNTDLYSLAVLLFYIFMVHHPLEGKQELEIRCLDLPAMQQLYGTQPLFIFDPDDHSNAPVPGYHDLVIAYWALYPQFLRDLFTRAFTDGIRDPQAGRVRESEWRAAMTRLRDSLVYCGRCGAENFYDVGALRVSGGRPGECWSCTTELTLPPRIRIGRHVVVLNHDGLLFPHHLDEERLYDFSRPVAAITRHPTDPTVWGLRNESGDKWVVTPVGGAPSDVEPGRSVTVADGTRIHFGKVEGEMRI
jgi:DNA-binding helix-hairpin-helix protein with protein kinase domain